MTDEGPLARLAQPVAVQPVAVAVTVALAGLTTLSGYAGTPLLGALGLAGAVLAVGWADALSLPSPRGTAGVLLIASAAALVAVGAVDDEPFLRLLPAGLALAMLATFAHQLMRRDGRPRLVESVTSTSLGVAVVTCGACLFPLVYVRHGSAVLAAAMAAVAASALAEPLGRWRAVRGWLLPVCVLLGVGAALLVTAWWDELPEPQSALLGAVSAVTSHAVRRAMSGLPAIARFRPQLASAAASVLLPGIAVYVVGRVFVA
ncbi:MAG TPA: hypothetical protein VFJ97_01105 [Dermatophilaceae bacterium]|nr:hypothetical protein [Dermatophilaceae bacterium]